MAYEEIDGVVIIKSEILEQIKSIKLGYTYQNDTYNLINNRILETCRSSSSKSTTLTGLYEHLLDYKTVLGALSYANELDEYSKYGDQDWKRKED